MIAEIEIFGLGLQTFGLMLGVAFLACAAMTSRRLRELALPPEWSSEFIIAAVVGGVVGSKVWFALDAGREDLPGSLVSGAGFTFYGGGILGAVLVLGWARRKGVPLLRMADIGAAPFAIGYAIGRLGCQLSGDGDYGIPSDLPWAMPYPDGTVPTTVAVHPTPLYECVVMGLVCWGLWRLRGRLRPGLLFALYLALAGLERFLVEFIRRNPDNVSGLTDAQFVALLSLAAGLVWLAVARARGGPLRLTPAAA